MVRERFQPDLSDQERSRKRFARRQWARRWLRLRLVLALAVLALIGAIVGWLVLFSSVLSVKGVDVEGNELLSTEQVMSAADIPTGVPLARADISAIRDRILRLPAVESADVSREWPDRILVRVEERVAVAVIERGGTLRGIDATGFQFRSYAKAPRKLPRIRIGDETEDEAIAEGAAMVASLPGSIARKVEYVELRTIDQIALRLRDGRTVEWGSAEKSADKAAVITVLLRQKAEVYDVSVPGQPTTR